MTTHVHAVWRIPTVLGWFVVASAPAALIGCWNLGNQRIDDVEGWRAVLFGAVEVVPLMAVALAVSGLWAAAFARLRQKPMDPGWFMSAWLYVLLLPPTVTPAVTAVGMSFGAVVGAHIFGGSGRYLVSPALLGVLFVHFSFPEFGQSGLALEDGVLVDHLVGSVPGTIGGTSALACLFGAALLGAVGVISWRVIAGGILGVILASLLVDAGSDDPVAGLAWYWHLVVGNFAFALVFLATDPSTGPLTRGSRWLYGGLIGLLTVVIRTLDPAHPEGTLFAVLLAGLAIPVLDYLVVRRYRLRTTS
jgi:Na+-transporting NADH:ubiquinone oxidoreductase subunit B